MIPLFNVSAFEVDERDILKRKDTSNLLPFEERLDLFDIPKIRFDRLEFRIVSHSKAGRFDDVSGDVFDIGLVFEQQFGELLTDKTCYTLAKARDSVERLTPGSCNEDGLDVGRKLDRIVGRRHGVIQVYDANDNGCGTVFRLSSGSILRSVDFG